MDSSADLQAQLDKAREARDALSEWHERNDITWEEYNVADQAVIELERKLATSVGDPFAETIDFPVRWDSGAPYPHLFVNALRALLAFYVSMPDPKWDGTYATIVDPRSRKKVQLALVEFAGCHSAKFGDPNDEVQHGHYLTNAGLEGDKAQLVRNSPWVEELRSTNAIHSRYDTKTWQKLNHYVFWFHDTTFECVAEGFTVEVFHKSMRSLMKTVMERLLK